MNVHTKRGSTSSPRGRSGTLTKAEAVQAVVQPSPIAPDCSGQDFYAADAGLRQLLAIYLPADARAHLEPHFKRLGVLAGGGPAEPSRGGPPHEAVAHRRDQRGR